MEQSIQQPVTEFRQVAAVIAVCRCMMTRVEPLQMHPLFGGSEQEIRYSIGISDPEAFLQILQTYGAAHRGDQSTVVYASKTSNGTVRPEALPLNRPGAYHFTLEIHPGVGLSIRTEGKQAARRVETWFGEGYFLRLGYGQATRHPDDFPRSQSRPPKRGSVRP